MSLTDVLTAACYDIRLRQVLRHRDTSVTSTTDACRAHPFRHTTQLFTLSASAPQPV